MKALILSVALAAFGQRTTPPVFHADSSLVPIEVQVVASKSGRSIPGLTRSDFVVLDESRQKEIVAFDDGAGPRDIALLLDLSGGSANEGVLFAASALLEVQRPEDGIALLSFSDGPAKVRTPLTRSDRDLRRGLKEIFSADRSNHHKPAKSSKLLDAIRSGADLLSNVAPPRRPMVIVVTHNREMKSTIRNEEVTNYLLNAGIWLEAITIPQEWGSSGSSIGRLYGNPRLGLPTTRIPARVQPQPVFLDNLHSVEPIAQATGGQVLHLAYANGKRVQAGVPTGSTWDVNVIAYIVEKEILARIRDQYGLAIRGDSSPQPEFHRLNVRRTAEAERLYPNAVISARVGYFTTSTRPTKP